MLSSIICLAVEANKKNRELYKHTKEVYHKSDWLQNFCTIHIDIGRGSGKTEYIKNNLTEKDVVLCNSVNAKREILGDNKNMKIFYEESDLIGISLNVENIYIDEPDLVFEYFNKEKVYDIFSMCEGEPTFILLGE